MESVPLLAAVGKILAEPILADSPQPPFHRVAMDGIAVQSENLLQGARAFLIEGMQKAGEVEKLFPANKNADKKASCMEVMTGAVLPLGADCVIPFEALRMDKGIATVVDEKYFGEPFGKLQKFRNVHELGSDCAAGDVIVPSGTRLLPQHIGAAAAFGYEKIKVKRLLQVGIIATGDELVSVSALPKAHQIRLSNGHAIEAALRLLGIESVTLVHSGDSEAELRKRIIDSLEKNEILILSGGVSMGRTDYVPKILAEGRTFRRKVGFCFTGKSCLGFGFPVSLCASRTPINIE